MPLNQNRRGRFKGSLLDDKILAPFQQQPQAQTTAVAPEAPAPRFTSISDIDIDWENLPAALSHIMPERKEELEQYHKKSARVDALGRAIGSLGGFVSAHMGGPVAPAPEGRSRAHMDRYEQLLLDYEDQKRAAELMVTQEILRDQRFKDQIEGQRDMLQYQDARRDHEWQRGQDARKTEIEQERKYKAEETKADREHRLELAQTQHDYRIDEINHRASLDFAAKLATQGQNIHDKSYRIRYKGQDVHIPATTAMSLAQRLTPDEYSNIFGWEDGKIEYNDKTLQRLVAKHGEDHLVPRFDQEGKFIEFDLKTSAKTPGTTKDLGGIVSLAFDQARRGESTAPQTTQVLFAAIDGLIPGMAVKDAAALAQEAAEAIHADRESGKEALRSIKLPENIRVPEGEDIDNLLDLLSHYHADVKNTDVKTPEELSFIGGAFTPFGFLPPEGRQAATEELKRSVVPFGFLPPDKRKEVLRPVKRAIVRQVMRPNPLMPAP